MINRILHSWSFHVKFMKLAEGSFHKFHNEMIFRVRSDMYNGIVSVPILFLSAHS